MPVAVVTGASRGLGKTIAIKLGMAGYSIAVNYLESESDAMKTVAEIKNDSFCFRADAGDMKQVNNMADAVYKKWGRVDLLVNNAGITKDELMINMKEEDWDRILRTNLKSCFNTITVFSEKMKKTGGNIINISSYSGLKGKSGQSAYSASKAGILGLTYTSARELAEFNIRVNALLPGYMQTEMGVSSPKAMENAKKESLLNRLSDPDEVAEFILNIVKTRNITGQVFCLDSRII
ncbi:MAG: SDR family NAD(P)-dependent oxidoreductase [Nitrospiraceae bacterium]|nr:SDR family NAD(P)-dependent oxidoreductase [Nitrospiraceae bacterium]